MPFWVCGVLCVKKRQTTNEKQQTRTLRAGPFPVREGTTTALRPGTLPRPCFCPAFLSSPASSAWGDPGAGRTWGCGCGAAGGTAYVSHPRRWHGLQTLSPVHGAVRHVKKPSSSSCIACSSLAGAAMPVSPVLQPANVCISIPYAYITRFGQCCTSDWRLPINKKLAVGNRVHSYMNGGSLEII